MPVITKINSWPGFKKKKRSIVGQAKEYWSTCGSFMFQLYGMHILLSVAI